MRKFSRYFLELALINLFSSFFGDIGIFDHFITDYFFSTFSCSDPSRVLKKSLKVADLVC
jgi:hypothetical protein